MYHCVKQIVPHCILYCTHHERMRDFHVLLGGKCATSWFELGHKVYLCGDYVFCGKCGSYSKQRTAKLGAACSGAAGCNHVTALRLERLRKGIDPITGVRLGNVIALEETSSSLSSAIGSGSAWDEVGQGLVELELV